MQNPNCSYSKWFRPEVGARVGMFLHPCGDWLLGRRVQGEWVDYFAYNDKEGIRRCFDKLSDMFAFLRKEII